jgi:hypothetical protein
LEEQVFEAGEQILRSGLRGACEQLLFEMFGEAIAAREDGGAVLLLGGLLLREMAQPRLFAQLRRGDAVRTARLKGAVFEPVNEEIESANRRRAVWFEAGDERQARFAAQVFDKLGKV